MNRFNSCKQLLLRSAQLANVQHEIAEQRYCENMFLGLQRGLESVNLRLRHKRTDRKVLKNLGNRA
ncbi:hypothetical protein KR51_00031580 [Rubidibacter lacunae KORDI 51-2]|uniref:Uncharacterized protein n=1 Tax=Rubidibacter lacunae KORDI 51-2 TaxID=582515 RepID=U5DHY3_9CHRO|nr:hypothetical protein KR51_00031580 [Rubidibacter lacunae KORDI 51-2]